MRSRSVAAVLVVLVIGAWPASASAATCGEKDPTSGKTLRGVLALDETQAVIDAAFKRGTGHRTLSLIFKVNGCELADNAARPTLEVNPRKGQDELPADAISIKGATPEESMLEVKLDVDSDKFKAGSYGASAVLRAPYMNSSRTPISVSRSDNRWWIPAGAGALAALAGLLVFTLLQLVGKAKLLITSPLVLALVGLVGVVAGAFLAYVSYTDQEIWTIRENLVAAATAGFGGATGGVMAGLLAGIWQK